MGRDELKRALEAMAADDALIDQVADGDVSALSAGDLTETERDLLAAAAADWPEVAGFDLGVVEKGTGGLKQVFGTGLGWNTKDVPRDVQKALDYASGITFGR